MTHTSDGVAPSRGERRSLTILDIAEEANVSKTTVSRVLTGSSRVAPETRARVLETVQRLDYHVNPAARTLRTTRSFLAGLLVPAINNDIFSRIAEVIEEDLRRDGIGLMIVSSGWDSEGEKLGLESLRARGVDAIVVSLVNDRDESTAATLRSIGKPTVIVDREISLAGADYVLTDQRGGIAEALEHLAELGHERIGAATISHLVRPGREAATGFLAECARLGLDAIPPITVPYNRIDRQAGWDLTSRLLELGATAILSLLPTPVTAGVLEYLELRDLRVPDDLSLIAFDESELASVKRPQLTVISRHIEGLARSTSRLVTSRLSAPDLPARVEVVSSTLLVRGSTGAPLGQIARAAR